MELKPIVEVVNRLDTECQCALSTLLVVTRSFVFEDAHKLKKVQKTVIQFW